MPLIFCPGVNFRKIALSSPMYNWMIFHTCFLARISDKFWPHFHPPIVAVAHWSGLCVPASHGYRGTLPVPYWWRPYSWSIHTSRSSVATTCQWGDLRSASGWPLPPRPGGHRQRQQKLIIGIASGGTSTYNSSSYPFQRSGDTSLGTSAGIRWY